MLQPPEGKHWTDILHVTRDSSREEVDENYKRLAMGCHPDVAAAMTELNRARKNALKNIRRVEARLESPPPVRACPVLSQWTAEINETVRANRAVGVSAEQCRALVYLKYGVRFSRNAVIGKAKRMGWPIITKPGASPGRTIGGGHVRKAKKKLRQRPLAKRFNYERPPPWHLIPTTPKRAPHVASPNEPKSRNIPLLKLQAADCRFPTSEEESRIGRHLFCGHAKQRGSSYCAFHHDVCNRRAA